MKNKILYLGADHAGFALKEKFKKWMEKKKIFFIDLGNQKLEPADDYPDFAVKVSRKVSQTRQKGILVCGSGQGMAIAANKIKGIRAAAPHSFQEAKLSREHGDANILCLGSHFLSFGKAKRIIKVWLATPFSASPRHIRRLNKIRKLEGRK